MIWIAASVIVLIALFFFCAGMFFLGGFSHINDGPKSRRSPARDRRAISLETKRCRT